MENSNYISFAWVVVSVIIHLLLRKFFSKIFRSKVVKYRTIISEIMLLLGLISAGFSILFMFKGYNTHIVMSPFIIMGIFWAVSYGLR